MSTTVYVHCVCLFCLLYFVFLVHYCYLNVFVVVFKAFRLYKASASCVMPPRIRFIVSIVLFFLKLLSLVEINVDELN